MNDIIVRTNEGQYVGGQTVYGAVYLRIFRPVNADMVSLTFTGYETGEWFSNMVTVGEGPSSRSGGDLQTCEVHCSGRKELFCSVFNLYEFEEGAVPLGCYAIPFHFTLQHGLPSSFAKALVKDDDQNISYRASIVYEIQAELQSQSLSLTDLSSSCYFEVKNEQTLNAFKMDDKPMRTVNQAVPSCFCFPRGDVNLEVCLDSISYTIGDTIEVDLRIDNSSSTPLKSGSVKLNQIIILHAYESRLQDEEPVAHVARVITTVQNLPQEFEVGPKASCKRIIPVLIPELARQSMPSANGSLVKCRYHIEASLKVPWGGEISLIVPITIFPKVDRDWENWEPPVWLRNVEVKDSKGICAVPRHLLESRDFMNVPLSSESKI